MLNLGVLAGFFHSLGFGRRYARGTNRSATGPVPPDPEAGARYFRPLPVESEEEDPSPGELRQKRLNRLLRPRWSRRISATFWVAGRKISRLHRALPLWLVAIFYLVVAGALCFLLTRPLLHPRETAPAVPLPEPPPIAASDLPQALSRISQWISEKDFARARQEIQKLEAEHPDDIRVLMLKGAVHAGERSYPEALDAFRTALDRAPNSAAAMMNLAEIEFVMGKYSEAETHYRKLLATQPKNPQIPFRLFLCAQITNDPAAAERYLNHPAIGTQSLEWHYMTAARELYSGNRETGLKILEKARLLFGEKSRPYDRTFARLGLIPEPPKN